MLFDVIMHNGTEKRKSSHFKKRFSKKRAKKKRNDVKLDKLSTYKPDEVADL